jgi:hypothetical protein
MTGYIVFGIIALIGIVDVVLIVRNGKRASISAWLIQYSKKHASVPFLIGFAMGHLFWVMNYEDYATDEQIKELCETVAKQKEKNDNTK